MDNVDSLEAILDKATPELVGGELDWRADVGTERFDWLLGR
ncbi:MAG: hypothetical protein AAB774_00835 [Patescibacteria group bacterium]